MITPEVLDQMLVVLRKHNVMSACVESNGDKIAVTLGPDFPEALTSMDSSSQVREQALVPGGWKTLPSDPNDPDPLGLGTLDAAPAIDPEDTEL